MKVTPSFKLCFAVLFLMAAVACDSSGPGSEGEATRETGSDSNITAPAGGGGGTSDGTVTGSEGSTTTGGSGATGDGSTTGDGTTTGGSGGSGSGGSGSGGSGSGGSGSGGGGTGGVTLNICIQHPELCLGPIEKTPAVGPSIGLPPGAGPGGWAEGPGGMGVEYDPSVLQKFRDGMPLSAGVTRFGTGVQTNIVFKDFAQGGTFRSTGEVTAINGVRKTFPAGTTFTVTRDIAGIFATLPDGTTETLENTAIFAFRDGATFTRAATNESLSVERGSAVQFRLGGFDAVQIGNTVKAPAVEQNLQLNR